MSDKLTYQEVTEILDSISCFRADGEQLHVSAFRPEEHEYYLQAYCQAPDNDNLSGPKELQKGRKWKLSEHMVETELVQTAWKAIEAFEVHELKERFKYRGKAIFNSHISVQALLTIADQVDIR